MKLTTPCSRKQQKQPFHADIAAWNGQVKHWARKTVYSDALSAGGIIEQIHVRLRRSDQRLVDLVALDDELHVRNSYLCHILFKYLPHAAMALIWTRRKPQTNSCTTNPCSPSRTSWHLPPYMIDVQQASYLFSLCLETGKQLQFELTGYMFLTMAHYQITHSVIKQHTHSLYDEYTTVHLRFRRTVWY